MKAFFTNLFIGILGALVGALGGWYSQLYFNETQYIDYVVYKSESMLSVEGSIFENDVEFSVNGKKVDDVSELDVYFLNESNADFEDVPIVIEFDQPDDWETISQNVLDQNNSKDLISTYQLGQSSHVRFGYLVKLMNRRGISPVFSIKYLIRGKVIPNFRIYAVKAGIETREYDKEKSKIDISLLPYFVAIIVGGVIILVLQSMINLVKKAADKNGEAVMNEIEELLKKRKDTSD